LEKTAVTSLNIPGYKILRKLGIGGQATVYLAIQKGFEREVALKVMSPALAADPSFGERFIREAKIVAQLSHGRIVTVYDVGKSENYYYLAMEYLRGEELKHKISQGLKAKEALQIIAKLAKALHFAHEKGYIHRDVKSENILFNDDDQPVLTDFGIAKASNSSTQMTQTGKLIGTPEYMSPEQCRGKELDGRSDLYSLGIIFYEMLTRTVPFTGEDSVSICIQHVTKPVPKLPARVSHFQWLVDSLLAKNPDKRFQTGIEVSEAIASFLVDGHPVRFESPSDIKTRISGVNDIPLLSDEYDDMQLHEDLNQDLHDEQQDEFGLSDNFYIEKPFIAEESKSGVTSISWLIIIVILAVAGYFNRDLWLPKLIAYVPASITLLAQEYGLIKTPKNGKLSSNSASKPLSRENEQAKINNNNKNTLVKPQFSSKQVQQILVKVQTQLNSKSLTLEGFNSATKQLQLLAIQKNNTAQLLEIKRDVNQLAIQQAVKATQKRDYKAADGWLKVALQLDPKNKDILTSRQALVIQENAYRKALEQQREQKIINQRNNKINSLLSLAEKSFKADHLASPEKENALYYLDQVTQLAPNEPRIKQQLDKIKSRYVKLVTAAIKKQQLPSASEYFKILKSLASKKSQFLTLENRLIQAKQRFAIKMREQKRKDKIAKEDRIAKQKRQDKLNNPLIKMQIESNLESAKNLMLVNVSLI